MGGGGKVGTRPSSGGGGEGGGGASGRHRNDFFPITFIVHNQKSFCHPHSLNNHSMDIIWCVFGGGGDMV